MKYKCLSIAGFDGSGGAGIQADLKTFSALGCYGMTVLTTLPVQNTCGVRNCYKIPLKAIEEQLEAIFDDIIPDSIKIGMLFSEPIIEMVANFLGKHAVNIPIVLDPVMVAKSGDALLLPAAIEALKIKLIPLSTIITPNLPEAYALAGEIKNFEELGEKLLKLVPKAVLLKGGHSGGNTSDDLFLDQRGVRQYLRSARIKSKNTHGTGCTLSAAICAFLAQGVSLFEACERAKHYLFQAMLASKESSVGQGYGPVHHFYHLWPKN
ncbi:MAG: bifunctional hydroxymethylpyrimidine kinase/phosphomethylpyrimidine kinase [Gammaproteobacteria bacterium]|jgi:hydroxymethylpyrimidine/phosphomethylpyrimidine kinase